MGLRIKVMGKEEAERFSHEFHDEPFYMISIHSAASVSGDPDIDETNKDLKDLLRLTFSDVTYELYCDGSAITDDDGDQIYYFASDLPDNALLVVHCRTGVSRSAAVAAALSRIFNGDESVFWSPPYSPNPLVYQKVMMSWYEDELYHETMEKVRENKFRMCSNR